MTYRVKGHSFFNDGRRDDFDKKVEAEPRLNTRGRTDFDRLHNDLTAGISASYGEKPASVWITAFAQVKEAHR